MKGFVHDVVVIYVISRSIFQVLDSDFVIELGLEYSPLTYIVWISVVQEISKLGFKTPVQLHLICGLTAWTAWKIMQIYIKNYFLRVYYNLYTVLCSKFRG